MLNHSADKKQSAQAASLEERELVAGTFKGKVDSLVEKVEHCS